MFLNYLPIFISLVLSVLVAAYAWQRRQAAGVRVYIYLILVEISYIGGYILELTSPSLEAKLFWDDFQFIGSMFIPYFLFIFAFEYTDKSKLLTRRTRIWLAVVPIILLILMCTNPLHGYFRTPTARIVPSEPFDALIYDFTTPMWVSFIYSYIVYLLGTIFFFRNILSQHNLFRAQVLIISIGFMFPFIAGIPAMAGIIIYGQRDITPYALGYGNLVLAWGLFRYRLFEVRPIARDAIMDYMNDVVIVLDAQSRVVDVNRAALFGLELNANQVIGLPISQLLADRPNLIKLFQRDRSFREDVLYTAPSGREFVLNSYISPLRDQRDNVIGRLLVARDITGQRQAEAELRKSYDELELRVKERTAELEKANYELEQKNAELERFTYTVSHDLKSPLVTISGYLGYLKDDIKTANIERLEKDAKRIASAAGKMESLLNDLLELSRIGRIVNPSVDVSFQDLVDEALELTHGHLEAGKVTVQTQPNLPLVYGDKLRLIEVLQNLIENAVKFMGDQPKPLIEIGMSGSKDNKPIFFVKDNGIGIAPEFYDRIFGLFNRLNPNTEGTGIGLALAKRIIEVHEGNIWVESEPGKGATFFFTLKEKPE